ncbi:MAG TPA: site-2 protease family protein [Tepidisphaeraceae bacterium]|nr:site-2 protease family protein [Tepidisphaeraceae bacterium]
MGWDDRSYYRDRSGATGNRLMWVLTGSVPLFTFRGIRVRAHASLLLFIALELALGGIFTHGEYGVAYRVVSMGMLFLVVLLHEFGHCFSARWMGGSGDDIMLWPLGGLAYADPPHRPWPTFVCVAFGPLVNVLICVVTASLLFFLPPYHISAPLNPLDALPMVHLGWGDPDLYLWWMYMISYWLLLFNILPLWPMDGGRMLHAALWPKFGDRRAKGITTMIGYPGNAMLAIVGVLMYFNLLIILIGVCNILECRRERIMLRETAPDEPWGTETPDFSASLFETEKPRRRRVNKRAMRRARKIAQAEAMERSRVDAILAKVSAQGMRSLTWSERRALKKATEHQRQRDLDVLK